MNYKKPLFSRIILPFKSKSGDILMSIHLFTFAKIVQELVNNCLNVFLLQHYRINICFPPKNPRTCVISTKPDVEIEDMVISDS